MNDLLNFPNKNDLRIYILIFRENNISYVKNLWLKGLGIGNGFLSAEDQSLYADYVNALTYLTGNLFQNHFFLHLMEKILQPNGLAWIF